MTSDRPSTAGAVTYERVHREIFNSIEQQRLHQTLREAVGAVQTGSQPVTALDYGCGSGNLTRHLIELGVHTVSADVSEEFMRAVREAFSETGRSRTIEINGRDLSNVPEAQFDVVATYSVLHHVPDYLAIVEDRVHALAHACRSVDRTVSDDARHGSGIPAVV